MLQMENRQYSLLELWVPTAPLILAPVEGLEGALCSILLYSTFLGGGFFWITYLKIIIIMESGPQLSAHQEPSSGTERFIP